MRLFTSSLRNRIFISMMLLMVITSVLIAGMSIYQFKEQAKDYHESRLERKEASVLKSTANVLRRTDFEIKTENLPFIFKERIQEISSVLGMEINIYDLDGKLLISSRANFSTDSIKETIPIATIKNLKNAEGNRYIRKFEENGEKYRSSYSYLTDNKFKNIGILNLPYLENDDFMNYELEEFLKRLSMVYIIMFLISLVLGYFLSNYITQSINKISNQLKIINIATRNKKLPIDYKGSEEINMLVNSYNNMVDQLEESAVKLATSEREQAWREMAKQVAHEIKNPLTPMRLTVQSFEMRFDPSDSNAKEKLKEFSASLIEQIDVMSNIASAFSTYASMPAQKNEEIDVNRVTQLALDIFNENYIEYTQNESSLKTIFDRTQLIRVVTNLVKNATQALSGQENPIIKVSVNRHDDKIKIIVWDNGTGVAPENVNKIFEPKFTTKNSGMGLGLAMVKQIVESYDGSIEMETEYGKWTQFTVTMPLHS
ncbi:ATP-binding protein [Nonlabens sp. SCSIO 43208]|uniref:sensor histidine kinase n=1 Tax=Nonlabens sp. SCSIO 43208 TaxID=2793009 RepID=UPI003D6BEA38